MSLNYFSWKDCMACYFTVIYANFTFLDVNNKEKPNTDKGDYKRLTCEKFPKFYNLLGKGIKFLKD